MVIKSNLRGYVTMMMSDAQEDSRLKLTPLMQWALSGKMLLKMV